MSGGFGPGKPTGAAQAAALVVALVAATADPPVEETDGPPR